MEQVLFAGSFQPLVNNAIRYLSIIGSNGPNLNEYRVWKIVSTDGLIKSLRVKLVDGSPGAGKKYTFTLMVNGAPTALTLEIADAATSNSNIVNEIDIVPGDYISVRCIPDGTPTVRKATWTCVFEGDTANESLILGSSSSVHTTDTEYGQVMGDFSILSVTENDHRVVIPTSGTIKNLYVKLNIDPGTAPDAYRVTVRLNGATVAQSLIVTIVANDTTGSDLVHNLVVVAGNILTIMIEPISTPSAEPWVAWGMTFVATIDGESIVMGGSFFDLDNANTEYRYITGNEQDLWGVTEAANYHLGQVCTLKKLYMLLSAAPGAGNTYTFTIRIATANSNVVAIVTGAATTGNSAALEDTVANDEYVDLQVVPDDTPNVVDAYWGLVSYRQPPVGGTGAVVMGTKSLILDLLLEGVI